MHSEYILWGQRVDEYRDMFDLSDEDLNSRLLEYGCGPSALNSALHLINHNVVSCDSLFNLDKLTLETTVEARFADMIRQANQHKARTNYSRYGSLESLIDYRRQGMAQFFADYESGRAAGRYKPITSETLSYPDFSFDLALSSHHLFVKPNGNCSPRHLECSESSPDTSIDPVFGDPSSQASRDDVRAVKPDEHTIEHYLRLLRELARVAKEVRVYPIGHMGVLSPLIGPVLLGLQQANYGVEVRQVGYPVQTADNAMLRIWAQSCQVG